MGTQVNKNISDTIDWFRALCKPARRGSGRGTYIQCQHSQLTGVEEKGQVLAMIQGAADPPMPLPSQNVCSDAAIAVGRRNETRTRLDPINKRQEARIKRKSFQEVGCRMDQTPLGTTSRMKPEQTKLALSPIKTEPAYLQNSPKAATAQIFLAPPLARNASSQTDNLTRQDKPSAGPKVSLQPPRPTTSVIWSAKSPFEVSRPVTLEATASSWKDAENVLTVPLPRCSTPKLFAPRSSPAITTTSKCTELESTYYRPSGDEVESMPKTFLRAETKSSACQNWQDSLRLDQRVKLPSWLEVAEQKLEDESRKTGSLGETQQGRLIDEKTGESDFFNSLFDYSGDELERLSPHSGDECISLTIPQTANDKMNSTFDISLSNGGPLNPQATLPSDLCEDFSQFFDSQAATQLPGDCTSYFEAAGPTELEPQDLAMLWSDQRTTSRTPPRADTEPPPWPSASSTSTSSHDGSLLDSRPIMLHSREYGKEEASTRVERDADAGASHDRGTKRTKKKSPVGVEIKRIKSEVKVLQRR